MPGKDKIHYSFGKITTDDGNNELNQYPTEFLNSGLSASGLPPHKLVLKDNTIGLLIRNLNTSQALINGTRMRVRRLRWNIFNCDVG